MNDDLRLALTDRGFRRATTEFFGKFWVVTRPTPVSELTDIVFESTLVDFLHILAGGLKSYDIVKLTKDKNEAVSLGQQLLSQRDIGQNDLPTV